MAGSPSTALGATQTLGGTATEGSLYLAVGDTGQMSVARYAGAIWQRQIYYNVPPYLASKGSKLYTATYGAQPLGYFPSGGPLATSNTLSGNVITTTWSLSSGAMQVTQRTTYTYPNAYYRLDWTITNASGNTISDLRFFHGEDTYLANGDNGAGWWDASTNSVGSYKVVNGAEQRMSLQGVTPPSYYVSKYFGTVRDEGTNNRLSSTLDTNQSTDNGYALEWDLASLGAGSSWNITAYEKFIAGSVGVLTVNSSVTLDCYAGQSVDVSYAVSNLTGTSVNATALLSGDQAWSQYIVSPAASFTVPGGSSVNVVVRVAVPAGTSAGTTGNFTLTVNDGSTNSSSTTAVIAKLSYTLTPSAGAGGTITPNIPQTVPPGGSTTFTIAPSTGYHTLDVTVDSVSVGAVSSYTFTNVQASHTIQASFAPNVTDDIGMHITSPVEGATLTGGTFSVSGTFDAARSGSFNLVVTISTMATHTYSFTVPAGATTWGPVSIARTDFPDLVSGETYSLTPSRGSPSYRASPSVKPVSVP